MCQVPNVPGLCRFRPPRRVETVALLGGGAWIRDLLRFLIGALFVALGATAAAVAYYRLRMVKEGVSAAEIVSVFD